MTCVVGLSSIVYDALSVDCFINEATLQLDGLSLLAILDGTRLTPIEYSLSKLLVNTTSPVDTSTRTKLQIPTGQQNATYLFSNSL